MTGSSDSWELDEEGMIGWGRAIGQTLEAPAVVALRGDLGAGKTTLARAIARGAGVAGPVPSPTYNLLFRYPAARGVEIVHLDLFRLEHPEEVWALGWVELPGESEIVLVEWPERAALLLPTPRWEVTLSETADPEMRSVKLTKVGEPSELVRPTRGE